MDRGRGGYEGDEGRTGVGEEGSREGDGCGNRVSRVIGTMRGRQWPAAPTIMPG